MTIRSNPPLQVVGFLSSRRGDSDRGPQVRLRADEAERRHITGAPLVWVRGPRRSELAQLMVDERVPRGGVVLRDIAGVSPSEVVRLELPDPPRPTGPPARPDPAP